VYKNRVVSLRIVKGSELLPDPRNWRTHSVKQRQYLSSVLSQVGYADAVVARETPDGLMVIDGHLRAELAGDGDVPVLVVDVSEEEAGAALATLDPLSMMATTNGTDLKMLLDSIEIQDEGLKADLEGLAMENQDWYLDVPKIEGSGMSYASQVRQFILFAMEEDREQIVEALRNKFEGWEGVTVSEV